MNVWFRKPLSQNCQIFIYQIYNGDTFRQQNQNQTGRPRYGRPFNSITRHN